MLENIAIESRVTGGRRARREHLPASPGLEITQLQPQLSSCDGLPPVGGSGVSVQG